MVSKGGIMSLFDIAQAVAKLLPGEWTTEDAPENWSGVFINGPENRRLRFEDMHYNNAGRLEIRGSFDYSLSQYLPYGKDREKTEITVAATKTPEQIAKAIISRLLPPYERMLARCKEGKARADEYKSKRQAVVNRVMEAMPGARQYPHDDTKLYFDEPHGHIDCYHDRVHIDITLPPDKSVSAADMMYSIGA
jgi:hypothetical protein